MGEIDLFNLKCELRDIIADLPDDMNRKDIYLLLFLYLLEKSYECNDKIEQDLIERYKKECILKKNSWKMDIMGSIMKIDSVNMTSINDLAKEICHLCKRDEKMEMLYNSYDLTDDEMRKMIQKLFSE